MAKGTVVQHLGEGLYRINLQYAMDRIKAELAEIDARIAELAVQLPEAKAAKIAKQEHIDQVKSYLDEWIELYKTDPDEARQGLTDNQKVLIRLAGELRQISFYVDQLIAEDLGLKKRRALLQKIPEQKAMDVWCADYTTDLSDDIGVIDINGEGGQGVVIQPGYSGEAPYSATRDGILMPREAQSGAQVYFNAAILPGVQKWFPRYRVGTIQSLDSDLASVLLDNAASSAQGLDINQRITLNGVPVVYMDCNAAVFAEGDRVVVRFTDNGPLVVGFESEPKACTPVVLWQLGYSPGSAGRTKAFDPRPDEVWKVIHDEPFYPANGDVYAVRKALSVKKSTPYTVQQESSSGIKSIVVAGSAPVYTYLDPAAVEEANSLWMTGRGHYLLICRYDSGNAFIQNLDTDWNVQGQFEVANTPMCAAGSYGENYIAATTNRIAVFCNRNASDGISIVRILDMAGVEQTTITYPSTDEVAWVSATRDTIVVSRRRNNGASGPDTWFVNEYKENGTQLTEMEFTGPNDNTEAYAVASRDYLYWYLYRSDGGSALEEIYIYDRTETRDSNGALTGISYDQRAEVLEAASSNFWGLAFDIEPPPATA